MNVARNVAKLNCRLNFKEACDKEGSRPTLRTGISSHFDLVISGKTCREFFRKITSKSEVETHFRNLKSQAIDEDRTEK
jgi:hypothetical protein